VAPVAESETTRTSRLMAKELAYAKWLAAERGMSTEEALASARRLPRSFEKPAAARPVIKRRIGNVLQFPMKITNGRRPARRRPHLVASHDTANARPKRSPRRGPGRRQ
jgi:hypothetical protein